MASGIINLTSNVGGVTGKIEWYSALNPSGNFSIVDIYVYVICKGFGIQIAGNGTWDEDGTLANSYNAVVGIPYGGSGTVEVYRKLGIKKYHNNAGDGGITLGTNIVFPGLVTVTGSGWANLGHIDQKPVLKINSVSKITCNTASVNYTHLSGQFAHVRYNLYKDGAWLGWKDISGYPTINLTNLIPDTEYFVNLYGLNEDKTIAGDPSNVVRFSTLSPAKNLRTIFGTYYIGDSHIGLSFSNPSNLQVNLKFGYNDDLFVTRNNVKLDASNYYSLEFTKDEITKMYSKIPNSSGTNYGIIIETVGYEGIYDDFVTISAIIEDSEPIFKNFTYEDTNTVTKTLTGNNQKIIKGFSNIKTTISAINKALPQNYATMKKYRATVGTKQAEMNYATTDVSTIINNVDSPILNVTAIDSRGFQTSVNKVAEIVDYNKVVINKLNILRENGVGTKVYFNLDAIFSNVNFGTVQNSILAYYRFKNKSETKYSNFIRIDSKLNIVENKITNKTDDTNFLCKTDNSNIAQEFIAGTEYDIQFKIDDKLYQFYSTIKDLTLNSGIPCSAERKNTDGTYSIGINEFPDEGVAFQVKGLTKVDGRIASTELATNKAYITNCEIYENLKAGNISGNFPCPLLNNVNLNDYKTGGTFYFTTGCTNAPISYFMCNVIGYSSNDCTQMGLDVIYSNLYMRTCSNNVWTSWKKFVSPACVTAIRNRSYFNFVSAWTVYNIGISSIRNKVDERSALTFTSQGIKITSTLIKAVKVSGLVSYNSDAMGGDKLFHLLKNNVANAIGTYNSGNKGWTTAVINEQVIPVVSGDVISLGFAVGQSGNMEFLESSLTVEAIY